MSVIDVTERSTVGSTTGVGAWSAHHCSASACVAGAMVHASAVTVSFAS
jgi:hypothetical protein